MVDFRQENTSSYDIRAEESQLIEAAVGLADWLTTQAETTGSQLAAIDKMRLFLRNLPAPPPPGFNGEFGFRFDHNNPDIGHAGCWMVSVYRGVLEIFCTGRDDVPEFEWLLCPGESNRNDLAAAQDWIAQVRNPHVLAISLHQMVIEATTWFIP